MTRSRSWSPKARPRTPCSIASPVVSSKRVARLEIGASLSFSGIVTFPKADDVRAAAVICPIDRFLVETDSPYLTPVPHRGQPNRPALVTLVGEAVAAARGVPVADVADASWANAEAFYRLA